MEHTLRLTRHALHKMHIKITALEVNERRAVISAHKGFSIWSWGEKILVLVEEMEQECIVRMFSKSSHPKITRDWGVNAANVRRFERLMRSLGIQYVQRQQVPVASQPKRPFFWRWLNRSRHTAKSNVLPPHEVLEIAPNASREEILAAYRLKVKMYHPDKVVGLAPEFQELAEERMKAINAAFQELMQANEAS